MGRATNWSRTVFIPETGDWWLDFKSNIEEPQIPPPSYDAQNKDKSCSINVYTLFEGVVLNMYKSGFEWYRLPEFEVLGPVERYDLNSYNWEWWAIGITGY
ncbi:hypothetical protein [Persephonella sp.]